MRLQAEVAIDPRMHVVIAGDHLIPTRIDRDAQNDMMIEVLDLCRALRVARIDLRSLGAERVLSAAGTQVRPLVGIG
jgi:hypothetical protein